MLQTDNDSLRQSLNSTEEQMKMLESMIDYKHRELADVSEAYHCEMQRANAIRVQINRLNSMLEDEEERINELERAKACATQKQFDHCAYPSVSDLW